MVLMKMDGLVISTVHRHRDRLHLQTLALHRYIIHRRTVNGYVHFIHFFIDTNTIRGHLYTAESKSIIGNEYLHDGGNKVIEANTFILSKTGKNVPLRCFCELLIYY